MNSWPFLQHKFEEKYRTACLSGIRLHGVILYRLTSFECDHSPLIYSTKQFLSDCKHRRTGSPFSCLQVEHAMPVFLRPLLQLSPSSAISSGFIDRQMRIRGHHADMSHCPWCLGRLSFNNHTSLFNFLASDAPTSPAEYLAGAAIVPGLPALYLRSKYWATVTALIDYTNWNKSAFQKRWELRWSSKAATWWSAIDTVSK